MRILVIGATGFIGPHVLRALARAGHALAAYHRGTAQAPLPAGTIRIVGDRNAIAADADRLRAFAPDVVVDLILSSGAQARAMLDVVRGGARRVVAASSMDVYRACGILHGLEEGPLEPLPLTEDSPLRTRLQAYPPEQLRMLQRVFGWLDEQYDKIPVERAVLGDSGIAGTVLRLPMVYGPGDPLHRFFPSIKRMDDGRRALLLDEATAQWRGPKGYVENVADAIALAAVSEEASGRVYNVAEDDALTELEWLGALGRAARWSGDVAVLPRDKVPPHLRMPGNLAQHWVADSTRIRRELGFHERTSRDQALRRTVAWERTHPPREIDPARFDYAAEDAALA
jgi:nucleoside-diphosphate-sugar epimerase